MRRRLTVIACHLLVASVCLASASFAGTVESLGDARIDERAGYWRIIAGGASMSFIIDPLKDYNVLSLVSPTGTNWVRAIGSPIARGS